jgi:hypothetical protein
MRRAWWSWGALGAAVFGLGIVCTQWGTASEEPAKPGPTEKRESGQPAAVAKVTPAAKITGDNLPKPRPAEPFMEKSLGWLAEAQHKDGGWGAGTHANQQEKDAHKVQTDPATTAFAAMTFLRAGNTPTAGRFKDVVRKATDHLLKVVEESSEKGPKVTEMTGTQPQAKLGPLVDTTMTTQYFSRLLPKLQKGSDLHSRVDKALTKCLKKLESSQNEDGSWNRGGGWAPVLQSSYACSTLEIAQIAGKTVDEKVLAKARNYQKGNFDTRSGKAESGYGAGVELYSFAGSQRGYASTARAGRDIVQQAKEEGKVAADAPVSEETFKKLGLADAVAKDYAESDKAAIAQNARVNDERLLAGFGNNGGEEFLSFMFTCESLIITGGDDWTKWNDKMFKRLSAVQNSDGSWSGHHCITSPVFCTAAALQCLYADRDGPMLLAISKRAAANSAKSAVAASTVKQGAR